MRALAVDDAEWERGRSWALWKALATCRFTVDDTREARTNAEARRVLEEIVTDRRAR